MKQEISPKLKNIMINSFVGGVFSGLGFTVGIALIAYILSMIVETLGGVPLVGDILANLVKATLEALKNK